MSGYGGYALLPNLLQTASGQKVTTAMCNTYKTEPKQRNCLRLVWAWSAFGVQYVCD
jgi:hypothetical protein